MKVYTSIEESKELLKLGLTPETSDMLYPFNPYNELGVFGIPSFKEDCTKEDILNEDSVHCWTTNAMLLFLQSNGVWLNIQFFPIYFDNEGKAVNNVWEASCDTDEHTFRERSEFLFDAVYNVLCAFLRYTKATPKTN